jgi:UDP-N-acetylglucosamine 2-epimerase (non-hydrolysing)
VLVLRDETERPEAIEAGVAKLVGHAPDRIIAAIEELLVNDRAYKTMALGASPYGDGHAAERIVSILERSLCGSSH